MLSGDKINVTSIEKKGIGDKVSIIITLATTCLAGDTVLNRPGNLIALMRDVKVGDSLLAWDENANKLSETLVVAKTRVSPLAWRLTVSNLPNGSVGIHTVITSADHRWYTLRGDKHEWVKTDELQRGDLIKNQYTFGDHYHVTYTGVLPFTVDEMWEVTCAPHTNYFAAGMLSHNCNDNVKRYATLELVGEVLEVTDNHPCAIIINGSNTDTLHDAITLLEVLDYTIKVD